MTFFRYTELPLDRLGWRQRQQVEAHLNQSQTVDNAAVGKFLKTLTYPLSFLDFETTFMTPVPLFNGTRPYQQVPFQYSLHIIGRPDDTLPESCRVRLADARFRLIFRNTATWIPWRWCGFWSG